MREREGEQKEREREREREREFIEMTTKRFTVKTINKSLKLK